MALLETEALAIPEAGAAADPAVRMDHLYRHQRHFYDLTRPCFLFGRDRLLRRVLLGEGERVLEVGCGTARNLVRLRSLSPSAKLYGLDASGQMLETARTTLRRRGIEQGVEPRDLRRTTAAHQVPEACIRGWQRAEARPWSKCSRG